MSSISVCWECGESPSLKQKISDPRMTTRDNPLAVEKPEPDAALKELNYRRLRKDAVMRACPFRGPAYSAIMDTRYKGE